MTIYDTTNLSDLLETISRNTNIHGACRAACLSASTELARLQAAYEALGGEVTYPTGEDDTAKLVELLAELEARD